MMTFVLLYMLLPFLLGVGAALLVRAGTSTRHNPGIRPGHTAPVPPPAPAPENLGDVLEHNRYQHSYWGHGR